MINKKAIFYSLVFLLPIVLVFFKIFLPGPLAWGDAPFFTQDSGRQLLSEPQLWTYRGNNFGGINILFWLSPIMILYGGLISLLGNDIAIRLVFFLPGILIGLWGAWKLAQLSGVNKESSFLSALLYILNTYFILLVDGGQVGVVLAYGLFSFSFYYLVLYSKKENIIQYIKAFLPVLLLSFADPRIFAIFVVASFLYTRSFRLWKLFLPIGLLHLYWLIPTLTVGTTALSTDVSSLKLISLLHSLTLFQPHWPGNMYGVVTYPYFYFLAFPIIISLPLLRKHTKTVTISFLLFLLFAFLAKGETPPIGNVYTFLVHLPFGFVIRDSSKFFIPLVLFAAVLIGKASQFNRLHYWIIYSLILLTVLPAMFGKMNFVLSKRAIPDYSQLLPSEPSRSLWFPEKPPTVAETNDLQAINAKDLTNLRIFANRNAGSSDHFNFFHDPFYKDWFKLLGISQLVLAGDLRQVNPTEESKKDWNTLQELFRNADLHAVSQNPPIYSLGEVKPHLLGSEKVTIVVGSDEVAKPTSPMVFVEDGKLDTARFTDIDPTTVQLFFNKKQKIDLTMSFLQNYFHSNSEATLNQWSTWGSNDYLKWKYELLIRDIDTKELDYGKGISFSTQPQEKLEFTLPAEKSGEYILAVRTLSKDADPLRVTMNNETIDVDNDSDTFQWFTKEIHVTDSLHLSFVNQKGVWVINTFALIPKSEWQSAQKKSDQLTNSIKILSEKEFADYSAKSQWKDVNFESITQTTYKVTANENYNWIFMSDSYSPYWNVRRNQDYFASWPFYSSFNGFYAHSTWGDTYIEFTGQKFARIGMYLSILSLLGLCSIILYTLSNER